MAKKVKTPEEVQASIDRKVARRKLFFGTFSKSLALFLAIAMVYSLATIAFAPPPTADADADAKKQEEMDEKVDLGGDKDSSGDTDTDGDNDEQTGKDEVTKAEAVKAINDATAKASKVGYKWSRSCDYTSDGAIDVGSMTGLLNRIIKGVAPGSDLNSVVGNFIGIGKKEGTYTPGDKGIKNAEGDEIWDSEKSVLKGMSLTEDDIVEYVVDGNVYKFQIKSCEDPQKNGKNALHKATNDFLTHDEAAKAIKDGLGGKDTIKLKESNVVYTRIVLIAEIVDGNLTKLELSYTFSADLTLTLDVNGKGKAETVMTYSDFKY